MAEIFNTAHCEKTFEDFLRVFQSILKNFSKVRQQVEGRAKNYWEELEIQESVLSKASFISHSYQVTCIICLLGIIVVISYSASERKKTRGVTKLKHRGPEARCDTSHPQ